MATGQDEAAPAAPAAAARRGVAKILAAPGIVLDLRRAEASVPVGTTKAAAVSVPIGAAP